MENVEPKVYCGIDISKKSFDVCVIDHKCRQHEKEFDNTHTGFTKMLSWCRGIARKCQFHFCMEATGSYHVALAYFLFEKKQLVSVVNAYVTHHSAIAMGQGNKTDPMDARGLAKFCQIYTPPQWQPPAPEIARLDILLRRRQTLIEDRQRETIRRNDPSITRYSDIQASIDQLILFISNQISEIEKEIKDHIDSNPHLKEDCELLKTIPGIALLTAASIIGAIKNINNFNSADSIAAYAGIAPSEYRSGSSIHRKTRIMKRGNPHLRRTLYMPALIACRYNHQCKALYDRLLQKHHSKKSARVAVMRKLLMQAYGVLKHRQSYNINWTNCIQKG